MNSVLKILVEKPSFLFGSAFIVLLMFVDILFNQKSSDFYFVVISIIWFAVNKTGKIDKRISFIIAIFFISICPLLMLFSNSMAEKAGIWAFLLLLSGAFLKEYK